MSNEAPLSGAVTPRPGASAAALAWRADGRLRVTVIAKCTFAFTHGGEMTRVAPQPIVGAAIHHDNNPARSIRVPSDLVPYRASADVIFTGSAHALAGEPVRARLGLFDGSQALFDKLLVVHDQAGAGRVPIEYERAYGGMGVAGNPVGTGADPGSAAPSVLDPDDAKRTIGLGPIAPFWPERKRLLGAATRKTLSAPIAAIPDPFDWTYFQAAPLDQRVRFLRGDEWIVMDGLHPSLPRVQMRLPGARGLARIHGLAAAGIAEGQPLELHADMLHIDGDEQVCTVAWRGNFVVPDEAALAEVRVAAGVELHTEPLEWVVPPAREGSTRPAAPAAPSSAASTVQWPPPAKDRSSVGTLAISGDPAAAPALPFQASSSPSSMSQPSGARPPVKDRRGTGTVAASLDEAQALRAGAMPFHAADSAAPAAPARPPIKDRRDGGTLAVTAEEEAKTRSAEPLPFHASSSPSPLSQPSGARPPVKDRRGTGTIAASPDDEASARGVSALPFMATAAPTPALEAEAPPAAAVEAMPEPPPPPAPQPPAPPPSEAREPVASPWAPHPEAAPVEPKRAPVQLGPTAATAAPKRGPYDRFGKR